MKKIIVMRHSCDSEEERHQHQESGIIRSNQDNTQRVIDVMNNHWQQDLQQRYNDARLELSQQRQNATIIAALKTTTTTGA